MRHRERPCEGQCFPRKAKMETNVTVKYYSYEDCCSRETAFEMRLCGRVFKIFPAWAFTKIQPDRLGALALFLMGVLCLGIVVDAGIVETGWTCSSNQ